LLNQAVEKNGLALFGSFMAEYLQFKLNEIKQ